MIVGIIVYAFCAYWTGSYYYKRRDVDLFTSILSCLVFTPLMGGIILYFLMPIRKGYTESVKSVNPFNIKIPRLKYRKRTRKWLLRGIGIILILMILLNPSYRAFKEYAGDLNTSTKKWVCKRVSNYLIYSVYEKTVVYMNRYDRWVEKEGEGERYIGFLMNFYPQ